jgi:hypothetical protein
MARVLAFIGAYVPLCRDAGLHSGRTTLTRVLPSLAYLSAQRDYELPLTKCRAPAIMSAPSRF